MAQAERVVSVIGRIGRPQSLATLAADQIRELIVTDQLKLGQQLSEAGLAEQLGISRTPVRDALLRLHAERLVEIQPQQGTYVFRYDLEQLRAILQLREILEVGALRVGLERDRKRLLATLAAEVKAAEPAVGLGADAYQGADTAFHAAIMAGSCNPELADAYNRIVGRVRAIRFRTIRRNERFTRSQKEHAAIVAAIRSGKDSRAEEILARHVYNSYLCASEEAGKSPGLPGPAGD